MPQGQPVLVGVGLYTRADAARLLKMSPSRVARWVRGYSYLLRYAPSLPRRAQPPVLRTRLPGIGGTLLLSFLDLMELRIVKALIDRGLSLQHVRRAARLACDLFQTPYPFASRRIFTDGAEVFTTLTRVTDDQRLIELSEYHPQLISAPMVDQYLSQLDFDPASSLAERWWPLGRDVPVVLDPQVAFGAPVIAGTSTRTDVVVPLAEVADERTAASAFSIGVNDVRGAVRFESELAMAA